jgi:hypothetical protein
LFQFIVHFAASIVLFDMIYRPLTGLLHSPNLRGDIRSLPIDIERSNAPEHYVTHERLDQRRITIADAGAIDAGRYERQASYGNLHESRYRAARERFKKKLAAKQVVGVWCGIQKGFWRNAKLLYVPKLCGVKKGAPDVAGSCDAQFLKKMLSPPCIPEQVRSILLRRRSSGQ